MSRSQKVCLCKCVQRAHTDTCMCTHIKNLYSSRDKSFQLISFANIKKFYNKYVYASLIEHQQRNLKWEECSGIS